MVEIEDLKPLRNGIAEVCGLSPVRGTEIECSENVCARLTWEDLTVTVTGGKGGALKVLQGLTGYAEPGTLTALMGPSGSGKSTLLDALSSRLATNAFLSGRILLNGHKTKLSFGTAVSIFSSSASALLTLFISDMELLCFHFPCFCSYSIVLCFLIVLKRM